MLKRTKGEKIFAIFNTIILSMLLVCTLYPCLYVVFAAFSDPIEFASSTKLLLKPAGFSLDGFKFVMENPMIWTGYANTIFVTVVGTLISVILTVVAAYGLSRKTLPGKNIILLGMIFTMYFVGGMIPNFLVFRTLGLLDSRIALMMPNLINTYNFIIVLTYFKGLPESLEEAAKIDGANEFTILFKIFIPLAKPVISVIALYYMVALWNDFMTGLLYINSKEKYPLQLVLREILFQGSMNEQAATADAAAGLAESIKYAVMVVSTIPILCVYPFIQRYFVKGVMIGAVKG